MPKGEERRKAFQDIVDYFDREAGTDASAKFERISQWATFEATGQDPNAEPPHSRDRGEPSAAAKMIGVVGPGPQQPPKKAAPKRRAA